ncbi:sensor histidine kinase [Phytohabitans aurantiacus]|uniref:sensor histidine kinase n=1 Tax=Phytohabitans aurantiacus TaxID=3016789 RepID=UPI0024910AD5|nr:sensor histidine kinase [Phytohabitans aurantiacus]
MSTGGDRNGAGRRLAAAARAVRDDLWTVAADPMPPMAWPRWLARLPHLLVILYALLVAWAYDGQTQISVLLTGVQAAAVVLALFRPVLAWWVVTLAMIPGSAIAGDPYPWSHGTVATLAGVMFLLALRARPRTVLAALAISVLIGLACAGFDIHTNNPNATWAVAFFYTDLGQAASIWGLAALLGSFRRARRVARGQLAAQSQISAEERARRTLLEERTRIARELHDVVAHHLSVISIQAQVAPHLVADPPEELRQNLASIRGNALEALTELRRVLGVLRVDSAAPDAGHAPQPTLERLDELVGNVRDAGLTVTTHTTGRPRPLPPGVELSAYRIVQEALSNAIRHAPGARVRVEIGYHPAAVVIRVVNTAPDSPPPSTSEAGHGLLGMRERVAMLGGKLATGPTVDGGFEVTANLPAPTTETTP